MKAYHHEDADGKWLRVLKEDGEDYDMSSEGWTLVHDTVHGKSYYRHTDGSKIPAV